jgi:uncharacterized protein YcnI
VAVAAAVVAVATPAWAHGQVRPGRAAAGATIDTVLVVPSERDGHGNSRIALALPPGFVPKSCGSPIGWRCTTADKGFSWERVTGLVEAEDFDLTMQVASTPGTYVLPLAQTYDDGETRTFTGGPGTRDEAPLFTVTGNTASSGPRPSSTPVPHPSASRQTATPTGRPAVGSSPTAASPSASGTVAPASASASSPTAPDGGLGALPAGRRLDPPARSDAPVALIAVGFLALTVLGGAMLLVRRRQPSPPGSGAPHEPR